jgi:hypothetical protein
MSNKINAYRTSPTAFVVEPLSVVRDWMDATFDKHAYHCFPVTLANTIGWGISAKTDIKFIWDGINDHSGNHVKILEGEGLCYTGRGQSTLSFNTNLKFVTDKNISLLAVNPPNFFNKDFEVISSVISTSFYPHPLPLAIKALTANKEITIKAGQVIAAIIPLSLGQLKDSTINVDDYVSDPVAEKAAKDYGNASAVKTALGEWTDWYRDAINEKGESVGEHEVKALKLKTVYVKDGKQCGTND